MIELTSGLPNSVSFEQRQQWEAQAVEKAQQTHTDAQLWARLFELEFEQESIERKLPEYYANAHGAKRNWRWWRVQWQELINAYDANADLMKVYAWHLQQRGHTSVEAWLIRCLTPPTLRLDN